MYRKLLSVKPIINRYSTVSATSLAAKTKADALPSQTQAIIDRETRYGAANYHPLPVAIQRGSGM
jgi:ornithine--oxo-acid transaminase